MRLIHLLTTFMLAGILLSCSSKNEDADLKRPSNREVRQLYELATSDNFEKITAKMASCKDMPATYTEEMQNALKMHAQQIKQTKGGIKGFSVNDIEAFRSDDGYAADAHIQVEYNDSTTEEILFRLVYDNGKWILR
ncbi:MAG: hypothetical protein IJ553_04795 [Alloprevotella sp.]|nr:hypothetical protein [Alloprevotella sp.]